MVCTRRNGPEPSGDEGQLSDKSTAQRGQDARADEEAGDTIQRVFERVSTLTFQLYSATGITLENAQAANLLVRCDNPGSRRQE